jgi:GNAT superfamily N-acetyltransferase
MSRKKKRQQRPVQSSGTVETNNSIQVINGWPAPNGARIRLARPGESQEFCRLVAAVGDVEIDQIFLDAIDSGAIGRMVLDGLRTGRYDGMHRKVRNQFTSGQPQVAVAGLASALLVEMPDSRLVGALIAHPPGHLIGQAFQTGRPLDETLRLTVLITKIKALAVESESRGQGLGSALLECVDSIYRQVGARLLYGQFRDESGLDVFYRNRRFIVMTRNEGLALDAGIGVPMGIQPVGSERLFARWLNGTSDN